MPAYEKRNQNKNPNKPTSHMHALIAGGISGGAAGYAGFYFEGLKKRLQSNQKIPSRSHLSINTWVKESFRGAGTYALCNIPATVVQQMINNYLNAQPISDTERGQIAVVLISGGLGGIPAAFLGNILLEQQLKSIGPLKAFSHLLTQGISRLFRGASLVMIREAMFGFCYLKGVNEVGKYVSTQFGPAFVLPAQLIVGALGSLASHPFDTVATTMQCYDYKNIQDASKHLWKENGIKTFYKGGAARIGLFTTTMLTLNRVQKEVLDILDNSTFNNFKPKF